MADLGDISVEALQESGMGMNVDVPTGFDSTVAAPPVTDGGVGSGGTVGYVFLA